MWYFTWALGLAFACAFAVLNAMWLEMHESGDHEEDGNQAKGNQPETP